MKRCPTCNRVESDDALRFCRQDGSMLIITASLPLDDSGPTQVFASSTPVVSGSVRSSTSRLTGRRALGEKDKAFAALEEVYYAHSNFVGYFKIDPLLNPLHDDPRFKALLKKSGFPQ